MVFPEGNYSKPEIVSEKALLSVPPGEPYNAGSGQSNRKTRSSFLHNIYNISAPSPHCGVFPLDTSLFHQKFEIILAEV
jgi:hypothetical protein